MLYVAIWHVSIRPVVMRMKEELQFFLHPHNNRTYRDIPNCNYSIDTLLKMDYWSPKHVELLNVMNKINHQILCILLDYRCIAKWYTVHTIPNLQCDFISVSYDEWLISAYSYSALLIKSLNGYGEKSSRLTPWRWKQYTPKRVGAEINVWFGIHGRSAQKLVNKSDVTEHDARYVRHKFMTFK